MLSRRFGSIVQGIVRVALASSMGAAAYACSGATTEADGADAGTDGGATLTDGGDPAFADESSFACEAPLPPVLDGVTPAQPTDYLELREQSWAREDSSGDAGGLPATGTAVASRGTACATAADKSACTTKLAALSLGGDQTGWLTDGDILGPGVAGSYKKQFLVFTRGDTVGALYNTGEVATFLGPIDTLEDARLLLATKNQALSCTSDPAKSGWRKNEDGSWELMIAGYGCGTSIRYRIRYSVATNGTITEVSRDKALEGTAVCGRRPEGLAVRPVAGGACTSLVAHLVQNAYLEAASVVAFRRLELELRRFGAPERLVARTRRARVEEIDHARETARLARTHGGVVPALDVKPMERRTLLAIALENAVEGCVRETYGALVAAFQAERCAPELRPLHRRIAREEASHAELAHDVARWLDRKLTPSERAEVAAARARALADLLEEVRHEPAADVVRVAGLPTAAEARILAEGLDRAILAAA
jgi:hypothetical protein